MAETESSHPLMMMSSRFVRQVREGYDAGIRYCFILGAGASVSSGIPLGTTLIRQWREYLLEQERRTPGFIRDCASEYVDWNYEEDVKPLFSKEYEVKSVDYFKFYDLRFAGMPVQAYSFLQGLMERARASYGYHALAILLNETKNRLIITTNFDSLVEDTLSLYNAKHPLVVGHESLAPFMESVENKGRTIIAKVHRDLLLHPQNRKEEMDKLDERWERALKNALSGVTPIVIGYAGGDHTLMSLLTKMDLGTIYWCTLDESEENVDDRILKLLRKQKNGRLVPIKGFDEIMYELFSSFSNIAGFEDSDKWMGTRVNESIKYHNTRVKEAFEAMTSPRDGDGDDGPNPRDGSDGPTRASGPSEASVHSGEIGHSPAGNEDATTSSNATSTHLITSNVGNDGGVKSSSVDAIAESIKGARARLEGDYEEALKHFSDAVRSDPSNAEYHHSRGVTLHEMGHYEEALAEYDEAVRLEPGSARYHHSRGVTLHEMGRHEEALEEMSEAVRLEPGNAWYHQQRGVTLHEMGRHEEALAEYDEAVRLEPGSARYHHSRGVTLHAMGRHEEALAEKSEAVRLEPGSAEYHRSRGVSLRELGRLEEALSEIDLAIQIDPELAISHGSRALTLRAMGREEEAQVEEALKASLSRNDTYA